MSQEDPLLQAAWSALAKIEDIEIPVSIVDMGMIRNLRCEGRRLAVDLTFTSMGCPGIEWTEQDVRECLEALAGGREVRVNVVWSPPWTADEITPRGLEALRQIGVIP
jgi:metal-sulfur cluster biosynthetic enzyme